MSLPLECEIVTDDVGSSSVVTSGPLPLFTEPALTQYPVISNPAGALTVSDAVVPVGYRCSPWG
jgi:hypothetical protein